MITVAVSRLCFVVAIALSVLFCSIFTYLFLFSSEQFFSSKVVVAGLAANSFQEWTIDERYLLRRSSRACGNMTSPSLIYTFVYSRAYVLLFCFFVFFVFIEFLFFQ